MMNIKINLLPPDKQRRLENLMKFIFSRHILEIIIFFVALVGIMMVWSWMMLQDGFAKLAVSSISVNKEYTTYNKDIRDINFEIKSLQKSSQNYNPLTPYLQDIINNLPANIKLTSFYINRASQDISLQGVAKTRQDLLDYQTELKKISWLGDLNTPVSKLFQKENISFEFKTKITGQR